MQAQQLSPIDTGETETITVDFSSQFAAGVTITAITSVTCTVHYGVLLDTAPSTRLIGAAQIGTSPISGAASCAVLQQVGNMTGGVTYLIQAIVTTSDNQTLSVWGYLPCNQPR